MHWTIGELAPGEKLHGSISTDERDAGLEQSILDTIGRALEIPPEILKLRFARNYGTTATALAEFELYMEFVRDTRGQDFVQPRYVEWLCAAWCLSDWRTSVKSLPKPKEETV